MVYLGSWLGLFFLGRLRGSFNPWEAGARLELEVGQVSAWVISLLLLAPTPADTGGSWDWQGTPGPADLCEGHRVRRQDWGSGGPKQGGPYSYPTMS